MSSDVFQKLIFERFFGEKITNKEIFTIKESFPFELTDSRWFNHYSWKGYLIIEYFTNSSTTITKLYNSKLEFLFDLPSRPYILTHYLVFVDGVNENIIMPPIVKGKKARINFMIPDRVYEIDKNVYINDILVLERNKASHKNLNMIFREGEITLFENRKPNCLEILCMKENKIIWNITDSPFVYYISDGLVHARGTYDIYTGEQIGYGSYPVMKYNRGFYIFA